MRIPHIVLLYYRRSTDSCDMMYREYNYKSFCERFPVLERLNNNKNSALIYSIL